LLSGLQVIVKFFIHGVIVTVLSLSLMIVVKSNLTGFLCFSPPIGTGFLIVTLAFVIPIFVGLVNAITVKRIWDVEFEKYSFWTNGFMLFLLVSSVHMVFNFLLNYWIAVLLTVALSPLMSFVGKYFAEE